MAFKTTALVGLLSVLLAGPTIYNADLPRTFRVMGAFRQPSSTVITESSDFVLIDNTPHCEDLHYHAASNKLFTACEGDAVSRYSWFPPLGNTDDPSVTLKSRGSIHVVDPTTMKSHRLQLENFDGPFVTHGIDVISDPDRPEGEAVYVFAINHAPNHAYYGRGLNLPSSSNSTIPKARSRIEIFHHELGTSQARHVRSVWHSLIRTPNDLVAVSPTSFFVTNDHHYREGLLRTLEDVHFAAKWTDTVHVSLDTLTPTSGDAEGVRATVALKGMHNNNGLGHGAGQDDVLVVECASGVLNLGKVTGENAIVLEDRVRFDSIIDNPSYFADPYADAEYDGSAYLLPGLTRAAHLHEAVRDKNEEHLVPVMVWSAKKTIAIPGGPGGWETKLLFEDDGRKIRSASAAVQVAIDPAQEGGKRKAWLYITGFMSRNMVAVKVDM